MLAAGQAAQVWAILGPMWHWPYFAEQFPAIPCPAVKPQSGWFKWAVCAFVLLFLCSRAEFSSLSLSGVSPSCAGATQCGGEVLEGKLQAA